MVTLACAVVAYLRSLFCHVTNSPWKPSLFASNSPPSNGRSPPAQTGSPRSAVLDCPPPVVGGLVRSPDHREGGDRGFLASCRIPAVLAVAVSAASTGATTGECGDPPVHSTHEGGQPHMGCASHSRRTAAARVRHFRAHGVALSSQPKRLSGLRAERSAGWPFLAAFDFFRVASLTFRTLYYFFVNRAWSPTDPTLQRHGACGQRVDGTSSFPFLNLLICSLMNALAK